MTASLYRFTDVA